MTYSGKFFDTIAKSLRVDVELLPEGVRWSPVQLCAKFILCWKDSTMVRIVFCCAPRGRARKNVTSRVFGPVDLTTLSRDLFAPLGRRVLNTDWPTNSVSRPCYLVRPSLPGGLAKMRSRLVPIGCNKISSLAPEVSLRFVP